MAGIDRYMRVLRLFSDERPTWSVAEMSDELETAAPTLYRIVREMVMAGMLEGTVEARYRLGALFVEYDRLIRVTDPLIRAGTPYLQPLVDEISPDCTVVLARLYNSRVMCVAEATAPGRAPAKSYEKGRPMPLRNGATSLAVLAGVPTRQLDRLIDAQPGAETFDRKALRAELTAIRRAGQVTTEGVVDPDLLGVAAPLRNSELGVAASLSVIIRRDAAEPELRERIQGRVPEIAQRIEAEMTELIAG